jgi:hypothetical protein
MEVYWHVGSVPFLDVDGDYVGAWFPCVISTLATRSIDIPQKLVGRAECQAFPDWHFHRSKWLLCTFKFGKRQWEIYICFPHSVHNLCVIIRKYDPSLFQVPSGYWLDSLCAVMRVIYSYSNDSANSEHVGARDTDFILKIVISIYCPGGFLVTFPYMLTMCFG